MQHRQQASGELQAPGYSFVYSYLALGILLLIGVFIFLPRVTSG